jgi:hypothetical protein
MLCVAHIQYAPLIFELSVAHIQYAPLIYDYQWRILHYTPRITLAGPFWWVPREYWWRILNNLRH